MAIKIEDAVEAYLGIRDELDKQRKAFKTFEAKAKGDMERLEQWLLTKSAESGVNSFATDAGTAFRTTKDYARVAGPEGWDKLVAYIAKTGDFGLLEKRIAKLHFKEVMEIEKIDPSDMGVEYSIEQVMQIRRPSK